MRRKAIYVVSMMVLAAIGTAAEKVGADISAVERERALAQLKDTRNGLQEAVKGLSEAQWNYKAGPDKWSIAEVAEHLALTEELITKGIFPQLANAPAPGDTHDASKVDAKIAAVMPDRSTKYQAPDMLHPTGRWTPSVSVEHFLAARAETVKFLNTTHDLRGHVVSHPAFGPLDGYEWVLAVAGHTARHTQQILEVKADAGYPKK